VALFGCGPVKLDDYLSFVDYLEDDLSEEQMFENSSVVSTRDPPLVDVSSPTSYNCVRCFLFEMCLNPIRSCTFKDYLKQSNWIPIHSIKISRVEVSHEPLGNREGVYTISFRSSSINLQSRVVNTPMKSHGGEVHLGFMGSNLGLA
jgi:hypothetical protein